MIDKIAGKIFCSINFTTSVDKLDPDYFVIKEMLSNIEEKDSMKFYSELLEYSSKNGHNGNISRASLRHEIDKYKENKEEAIWEKNSLNTKVKKITFMLFGVMRNMREHNVGTQEKINRFDCEYFLSSAKMRIPSASTEERRNSGVSNFYETIESDGTFMFTDIDQQILKYIDISSLVDKVFTCSDRQVEEFIIIPAVKSLIAKQEFCNKENNPKLGHFSENARNMDSIVQKAIHVTV
jgi:hypothetical protein